MTKVVFAPWLTSLTRLVANRRMAGVDHAVYRTATVGRGVPDSAESDEHLHSEVAVHDHMVTSDRCGESDPPSHPFSVVIDVASPAVAAGLRGLLEASGIVVNAIVDQAAAQAIVVTDLAGLAYRRRLDWRVVEPVRPRGGPRGIRVIDDPDHFAPMFGRPPSDLERAALVAGKAISWNGTVVDDTLIVGAFGQIPELDQAPPKPVETRALPALAAPMTEYGRRRDAAVITASGAAAAGLPVERIGTLFPAPAGDTDARVAAVRQIVDSGGSAFTLLQLHIPYQPFPSPARQVIGQLGGWLVFAVAVLLFGQMSRSRGRDLNTLFSLGVPRRFQLITSGIEAVILGCYAVIAGLFIGILAAGL